MFYDVTSITYGQTYSISTVPIGAYFDDLQVSCSSYFYPPRDTTLAKAQSRSPSRRYHKRRSRRFRISTSPATYHKRGEPSLGENATREAVCSSNVESSQSPSQSTLGRWHSRHHRRSYTFPPLALSVSRCAPRRSYRQHRATRKPIHRTAGFRPRWTTVFETASLHSHAENEMLILFTHPYLCITLSGSKADLGAFALITVWRFVAMPFISISSIYFLRQKVSSGIFKSDPVLVSPLVTLFTNFVTHTTFSATRTLSLPSSQLALQP